MNPTYDLRTPRPRPLRRLLVATTRGGAALIICAVLFGALLYANGGLRYRQWIRLSDGQSLGVGVFPGCPPAMPEMACLHIERQFPPTFRVMYRSAGESVVLVSIALPRR
jgi:hypothetical protein